PTVAVSELLRGTGLALQDFDYYEIHEAFAAQVLATLKAGNRRIIAVAVWDEARRSGRSTGGNSTSRARQLLSGILLLRPALESWQLWPNFFIKMAVNGV